MQLINTNVFDKETQARSKAMAETRRERAFKREQGEKRRLEQHLQNRYAPSQASSSAAMIHEINIDGLRFQVLNRGSRLLRIRGESFRRHGMASLQLTYNRCRHVRVLNPQASYRWWGHLPPKQEWKSLPVRYHESKEVRHSRFSSQDESFAKLWADGNRATGLTRKISQACKRFTTTGKSCSVPSRFLCNSIVMQLHEPTGLPRAGTLIKG